MNTLDDYTWKQRELEWFVKVIGQKIEYASLSLIRQPDKKEFIPKDTIHGERDAEYHFKLGTEYQYYYRISKL